MSDRSDPTPTRPASLPVRRVASVSREPVHPSAPGAIAAVVDPGSFVEWHAELVGGDPLSFVDRRGYPERIEEARTRLSAREAVVQGSARIRGTELAIAAFDFHFLGGGLGSAVGEKLCRLFDEAAARDLSVVVLHRSGGARMQEGTWSLLQMSKVCEAVRRFRASRRLFVSVLGDPTMGGTLASSGALGDVILAERGARIGFAGARVTQQALGLELDESVQTAEAAFRAGFADRLVEPRQLRATLAPLVRVGAPASPHEVSEPTPEIPSPDAAAKRMELVRKARKIDRPRFEAFVGALFTNFVELRGDRCGADDAALRGGFARFREIDVMVVGTDRGSCVSELKRRNFGMVRPAGYRKAVRLYRLAARKGLPIVTLVDTPGADPSQASEEGGIAFAVAEAIEELGGVDVPTLGIVVGEGGSGGALALLAVDTLVMLENTHLSVISPEGCAGILWRDRSAAPVAAEQLRSTAADLFAAGVADRFIRESDRSWEEVFAALRRVLAFELFRSRAVHGGDRRRNERNRRDRTHLRGVEA